LSDLVAAEFRPTRVADRGQPRKRLSCGNVIVTPSMSVLGGASRSIQTFFQQRDATNYYANSEIKWTDWGARFGLGATLPVMTGLDFGLNGKMSASFTVTHRFQPAIPATMRERSFSPPPSTKAQTLRRCSPARPRNSSRDPDQA
jgi:hypothetical protein